MTSPSLDETNDPQDAESTSHENPTMANEESEPTPEENLDDELSMHDTLTLEKAMEERDKYLNLAQRARAEFENYQRRMNREMQQQKQFAAQPLASDLLSAIDNLDRAISSAEDQKETAGILEGIKLVRKQLLDTLAKHSIEQMIPDGEPFDPHHHEAVMQQPSGDCPPMTVLQTVETGYMLHDRVIRPAKVIVSVSPA
ncbi:heat shock protein GrpE [Planctomycetes bacterium Pan216]|uniref:Protein GrpE n=1 Tax=Kolteria novifilia TaxID=2527975 RepID=A0A518B123_9BACT|nr:heat shock protein GrpE [Planctomycetes bacterium Pan216]